MGRNSMMQRLKIMRDAMFNKREEKRRRRSWRETRSWRERS